MFAAFVFLYIFRGTSVICELSVDVYSIPINVSSEH